MDIMPARVLLCLALLIATSAMPQNCMNNSGPCVTTLTNAASFEAGPVAPGELVSIFGTGLGPQQGVQPQATLQSPFPTKVANVEVSFDGTPAPLLWVQDAQINAVAPWSLTPGMTTQVCVSYNNTNASCLTYPVVQTAPAVFLVDSTYNVAAALNQDGSINSASNPAPPGSIVTVWATGLGTITPRQADGTLVGFPLPHNVMAVEVNGTYQLGIPFPMNYYVTFNVTYAGPAPYLVAGVSQINFEVSANPSNGMPLPGFELMYVTLPSSSSPTFAVYVQ